MDRRDFLKASIIVVPALAACSGPAVYDRQKYGAISRVGIIQYPKRYWIQISTSSNMYSAAGENHAIQMRVEGALGEKLAGFEAEMHRGLAAALADGGIGSTEIAYRESKMPLNPTMRIIGDRPRLLGETVVCPRLLPDCSCS